jgi:hypothetical protein
MTKRQPAIPPHVAPDGPDDKSIDPEERLRRLFEFPTPAPRWVDPTRKDHVKPRLDK